ncbi:hypothetical protein N9458_02020 [Gammaproteobacteria bacterium]|nr:hypothetical protein [Gammaproteobacteria bacterium]
MKKLSVILTILILVSCQPSELDRCIKANMPELSADERGDILYEILKSYEIVFPDETSQEEFYVWFFPEFNEHLGDLISRREFYDFIEDDALFAFEREMKVFKNVFDYNIKYYDINEEVIVETRYKETATSICNAQGIY